VGSHPGMCQHIHEVAPRIANRRKARFCSSVQGTIAISVARAAGIKFQEERSIAFIDRPAVDVNPPPGESPAWADPRLSIFVSPPHGLGCDFLLRRVLAESAETRIHNACCRPPAPSGTRNRLSDPSFSCFQ